MPTGDNCFAREIRSGGSGMNACSVIHARRTSANDGFPNREAEKEEIGRPKLMATLYPSWIEIPVENLERALTFYRAVFGLIETPLYEDEPPARITVLLPSEKSVRNPGVSLVQSPTHRPSAGGAQINFPIGDHPTLVTALEAVKVNGAQLEPLVDTSDGVKYVRVRDSEGNTLALSSYEPLSSQN
jgi:uncharacterized protein